MIEFCASVRKEVLNGLLNGKMEDIDEIADLMTNLDNDALEFTVLFEKGDDEMMVKRMVDGFTRLFDVLDEMENVENKDVFEKLGKENLRTPVIRSSTLKSEYRTDSYSPFKIE